MLGLLIIYWVGKWYFTLAEKHNKSKWLYAVLGALVYVTILITSPFLVVLIAFLVGADGTLELPQITLSLMGILIGLIATWALRAILKRQWENTLEAPEGELLDDRGI
ncbi:MAG: protein-S-isoprenylcysteine O-methyltransferase Ste14 [Salibacteraceae bacterium]|jgi:protein-S-isoprenylcysteine O-methyltransferase Ste14